MLLFYLSLLETEEERSKCEELYDTYHRLMYTAAYDILKDHYLCEDAVHEAFIRILNNLNRLHDISSHKTKAFVVIVVSNEAKRLYMKRKRNVALSFEKYGEIIHDYNQDIDLLLNKFDSEIIAKQLALLPQDDANILMLKYIHEIKDKDIAKLLGISDSATRKRLEWARGKLAVLLEKN